MNWKLHLRRRFKALLVKQTILLWRIRFVWQGLVWGNSQKIQLLRYVPKLLIVDFMRNMNASIGDNCDIETGITYHNCHDLSKLKIGNDVHIGKNCFIDLRDEVLVGDRCTISMGCTLLTHTDMGKSKLNDYYSKEHKAIVIDNDVYVGANSTIFMDTIIGTCSVIGAGSIVKGVLQPYSVYAGVPVKKIQDVEPKQLAE